jgi:hypothetical protein
MKAIMELMGNDFTDKTSSEVGELLGMSSSRIRQRVTLFKNAAPDVIEALNDGTLLFDQAWDVYMSEGGEKATSKNKENQAAIVRQARRASEELKARVGDKVEKIKGSRKHAKEVGKRLRAAKEQVQRETRRIVHLTGSVPTESISAIIIKIRELQKKGCRTSTKACCWRSSGSTARAERPTCT